MKKALKRAMREELFTVEDSLVSHKLCQKKSGVTPKGPDLSDGLFPAPKATAIRRTLFH